MMPIAHLAYTVARNLVPGCSILVGLKVVPTAELVEPALSLNNRVAMMEMRNNANHSCRLTFYLS